MLALLRANTVFTQHMMKKDQINDKILCELAFDGRISNTDLAEKIGLSPSACLRRVQELERSGVIKGYRAILDPSAMGAGFTSYILVGLSDHSKQSQETFQRSILRSPEVKECHNITGTKEYLLRVEVHDIAAYKIFHTDVLGTLPQVNALTTYVVMASPKDLRA